MKQQLFYLLLFLHLIACQSDVPSTVTTTTEAEEIISTPLSLTQFLSNYKNAIAGEHIPLSLSQHYIKPALKEFPLHPYLDTATYSYGEVVYQDSLLAVLTFFYKAQQDKNLMAASFVASYSKKNNQLIDSKMVFGSSVFNLQESKGYDFGFSCKSDLIFINDLGYLLLLTNSIHEMYSQHKSGVHKENKTYKSSYKMTRLGIFEPAS